MLNEILIISLCIRVELTNRHCERNSINQGMRGFVPAKEGETASC
jgi:hypothetical protein